MRVEQRTNKQYPTQSRLRERSISKLNPEMVVEIPEQIFIVRNFMADLMAKRPDFNLLPIGRYSGKKNGKNRKNKNSPPPTLHRFFFHRPYILLIFKLPEGLLVKVAVAVAAVRLKRYFILHGQPQFS